MPEGVQAVVAAGLFYELLWLPAEHITKLHSAAPLKRNFGWTTVMLFRKSSILENPSKCEIHLFLEWLIPVLSAALAAQLVPYFSVSFSGLTSYSYLLICLS